MYRNKYPFNSIKSNSISYKKNIIQHTHILCMPHHIVILTQAKVIIYNDKKKNLLNYFKSYSRK